MKNLFGDPSLVLFRNFLSFLLSVDASYKIHTYCGYVVVCFHVARTASTQTASFSRLPPVVGSANANVIYVYLIRHAQSVNNQLGKRRYVAWTPDPLLSDPIGWEQVLTSPTHSLLIERNFKRQSDPRSVPVR